MLLFEQGVLDFILLYAAPGSVVSPSRVRVAVAQAAPRIDRRQRAGSQRPTPTNSLCLWRVNSEASCPLPLPPSPRGLSLQREAVVAAVVKAKMSLPLPRRKATLFSVVSSFCRLLLYGYSFEFYNLIILYLRDCTYSINSYVL